MNCIATRYIEVNDITVEVPCNRCIPCLINKRNDWSFRLEQEYKHSRSALFVTLTYDEKHLPTDASLNKKHIQDYLKRLRKRDGTNTIRYFAVGEYGSNYGRPHYHVILFNCSESHARASWNDSKGNPIGMVHIGKVTAASIAYCTKYIVQPELSAPGLQKPFSLMSRKYGIGAHYLTDEMVAWHRSGMRNYTMRYDQKCRLPRFYREKIWPSVKAKKGQSLTGIQSYISQSFAFEKQRVSNSAKTLVNSNREKEIAYWKEAHPTRWEAAMAESRNAIIERVKSKVKFTQTF